MRIRKILAQATNRIKRIDPKDLLNKANNINLEDLRNISSNDIKKFITSPSIIPILGITAAVSLSFGLLKPRIINLTSLLTTYDLYLKESKENPRLSDEIMSLEKAEENIIKEITPINKSALANDQLIYLTELLNKVSLKSQIQITSFEPISRQQKDSCSALSQDEVVLLNPLKIQEKSIPRFGMNSTNANRDQKSIVNNNQSKLLDNFYRLELRGNYLKLISFINYIQDYNVILAPNCFKTEVIINSMSSNKQQQNRGKVKAELIFNVPSKLAKG